MADQTHPAGWVSRGWMSFTVADAAVLYLGGSLTTVPTLAMSGGKIQTDPTCFLVAGIPQDLLKTRFADPLRNDMNGHNIKHAIVNVISAGATSPAGRRMVDGSVPITTHGAQVLAPSDWVITNNPMAIFNFKLFNRSGGNMLVEVEVFE